MASTEFLTADQRHHKTPTMQKGVSPLSLRPAKNDRPLLGDGQLPRWHEVYARAVGRIKHTRNSRA